MPKMKSNRAAKKRFTLTGKGKVKRNKAYASHQLDCKSPKRKRKLRKSTLLAKGDAARAKKAISA